MTYTGRPHKRDQIIGLDIIEACRAISGSLQHIIRDNYNPSKCWLIFKTKCGHYHLAQMVCGRITGLSLRCGKSRINEILN